jgi:enolase
VKHTISRIDALEILDSRGNPTLEVVVKTEKNIFGVAKVPSGASTGTYEAVELRDGGTRFHGKGVMKAIENISAIIAPKIIGIDVREQEIIDNTLIELDGTPNKSRLGGNAILGVSLACTKAAANSEKIQLYEYLDKEASNLLPIPFFNIINGGKHAGNNLDFQEFMIVPAEADSFREALMMGSEIYHELRKRLQEAYGRTAVNLGDEGGFCPPIDDPREALDSINSAVEQLGYQKSVSLALDVAATSFYAGDEKYVIAGEIIGKGELIELYKELTETYPIISIEDPLEEEDYGGFKEATESLRVQILGDDLFVSNSSRLVKGVEMGAADAIILKVNQVGTLTEALKTAKIATENNYRIQVSHRSGETEDTFVSDLAVGIGCGQIKSGAPARGERTSKYNRLLRIENYLGSKALYPKGFFKNG